MTKKTNSSQQPSDKKNELHPRNKHSSRYNLDKLAQRCPELTPFIHINQYDDTSIDFSDPNAVKMLNKALLQYFYNVKYWDIPEGYLCPPVPGRADYIHYVADLLASSNHDIVPKGKNINALDIGTGANVIYPIIGVSEYGWSFTGSDVDKLALKSAKQNVERNGLMNQINIRQQNNLAGIYKDIILPGEKFDVTMCNPPFHSSLKEATEGTKRKIENLTNKEDARPALNFGGRNAELWYPGGEAAFISKMIFETSKIPAQCFWFTTLVSKKDNLYQIEKALKKTAVYDMRIANMAQGQKQSRVVAWTFLDEEQQKEWRENRWINAI